MTSFDYVPKDTEATKQKIPTIRESLYLNPGPFCKYVCIQHAEIVVNMELVAGAA